MMAGQELGDGPGGAGGGPLLPLTQLTAFVDGVHQQEESLLRRLHTQERQEDASEERRRGREMSLVGDDYWCRTSILHRKLD